jgi:hypothetical protein
MASEIDLLTDAYWNHCAIVEKETHGLWSKEELLEALALNEFEEPDELTVPDETNAAGTSIFPGCMHQGAALEDYSRYQVIGQTRHFLIFAKPNERPTPTTPTSTSDVAGAVRN